MTRRSEAGNNAAGSEGQDFTGFRSAAGIRLYILAQAIVLSASTFWLPSTASIASTWPSVSSEIWELEASQCVTEKLAHFVSRGCSPVRVLLKNYNVKNYIMRTKKVPPSLCFSSAVSTPWLGTCVPAQPL